VRRNIYLEANGGTMSSNILAEFQQQEAERTAKMMQFNRWSLVMSGQFLGGTSLMMHLTADDTQQKG